MIKQWPPCNDSGSYISGCVWCELGSFLLESMCSESSATRGVVGWPECTPQSSPPGALCPAASHSGVNGRVAASMKNMYVLVCPRFHFNAKYFPLKIIIIFFICRSCNNLQYFHHTLFYVMLEMTWFNRRSTGQIAEWLWCVKLTWVSVSASIKQW